MSSPLAVYQERLGVRQETLLQAQRRDDRLANVRLGFFATIVAAAGAVAAGFDPGAAWQVSGWWLLLPPTIGFIVAIIAHDKTTRSKARAADGVDYTQRGIDRLNGKWAGRGVQRDDFVAEDHAFSRDLDLFGAGSLFELLCQTRTRTGEEALASWLSQSRPPAAEEIRARQVAVRELQDRLDLREALATDAGSLRAETHPDILFKWAEAPAHFDEPATRRLALWAWIAAIAAVSAGAAWGAGFGPMPLIGVAVVEWVVARLFSERLAGIEIGIAKPAEELPIVATAMARLEAESFACDYLRAIQQRLSSDGQPGSRQLRRLVGHVQWLEAQRNQLFAPIGFLLQWSLHFGLRIETWRQLHGPALRQWLQALGELEALCSIANFAYENPDYPMPEVVSCPKATDAATAEHSPLGPTPRFSGDNLGHPLLGRHERVNNSVSLHHDTRMWIISGSNMSGKSTLLRTVGINTVLAMAGAPVCGESLTLSPLAIGATLRVQDSLASGTSRFYAEIKRLKQILDLAEGLDGHCLFLLDEILSGTNSHDRRIGARALIRSLLQLGTIGLVTTHDLALTQHDEDELVRRHSHNVHFEDQLEGKTLAFDYTLRQGVVQGSNALALMRSLGLRV